MTSDALRRLELTQDCTVEDLELAFRQQSLMLHPDRGGSKRDFQQLQADFEAAKRYLQRRQRPLAQADYDPTLEWLQRRIPKERRGLRVYLQRAFVVATVLLTVILFACIAPTAAVVVGCIVLPFGLLTASFNIAQAQPAPATITAVCVLVVAAVAALAVGPSNLIYLEIGSYPEMHVVSVVLRFVILACALFAISAWIAAMSNF